MHVALLRGLAKINVAAKLCEAALGPKHPVKYRLIAGFAIMGIGVAVTRAPEAMELHFTLVRAAFDLVGNAVHGVGLVPFLEVLLKGLVDEAE